MGRGDVIEEFAREVECVLENIRAKRLSFEVYGCDLKNVEGNCFEIVQDAKIDIKSSGVLDLVVCSDLSLFLNFEADLKGGFDIRIKVKEGVNLELVEFACAKDVSRNLNINVEDRGRVSHYCVNFGIKHCISKVNCLQDSFYEIFSVNLVRNQTSFFLNEVYHRGVHSYSDMKIKNIAMDSSKIYSVGKVDISKDAFLSEGFQMIRGLILDDESKVFAKPVLEVKNNDIKCSHGASISQIDEDLLFYLNARGIDKKEGVNLVINGFFDDLTKRIKNDEFCEELREKINIFL